MLARVSLGKESSAKVKTAPASKEAQPRSREQEQSLEELTPPKFSWHIGNIAVSGPGDSGRPNPGENGAPGGPAWHFARPLPLPIQAKLEVGAVDDPLELEADRVAEQVMRMPDPRATNSGTPRSSSALQKASPTELDATVQRKPAAPQVSRAASSPIVSGLTAPPVVHEVLRSPGQPLDATTRAFMEPRFGWDFSRVRIHADITAASSAREINARAYTAGNNLVFAAGQFSTQSPEGQTLLAHELTHSIQQSDALSSSPDALVQRTPNDATNQTPQTSTAPKLPWYQQQQLEAIEGKIQDWTEDEKNIARSLLRKWIDLQNKRVEKATIASQIQEELLTRYYKPWLQAEDQVIQDYCHTHHLGPRERFGGGISCEPLFTGDRQLGENELASMRSYMKVTGEDEAPLKVVHQWVREYRNRTNPEKLKEAGLIQTVLLLLSVFATPGGEPITPASRPAVEPPVIAPGEGEIKVGDVHSIPGIGARRVIAVRPNGDVVYESGPTTGGAADPSMKPAPPAQKQLPPGPKTPDTKQITSAPPSMQKQVTPAPPPTQEDAPAPANPITKEAKNPVAKPEEPPAPTREKNPPIDSKRQVRAKNRLEQTKTDRQTASREKAAAEHGLQSARARVEAIRTKLTNVPQSLASQRKEILNVKDLDDRLDLVKEIRASRSNWSPDEKVWLDQQVELLDAQLDVKAAETGGKRQESIVRDANILEPVHQQELAQASKSVADLIRSEGPNYRARDSVNYDQIMGEEAWKNFKDKVTAKHGKAADALKLNTDHIIPVREIRDEVVKSGLLELHDKASPAVKEQIEKAIAGLGDERDNLKRMANIPNNLKSDRSWFDIQPGKVADYYTEEMVEHERERETELREHYKGLIQKLVDRFKK